MKYDKADASAARAAAKAESTAHKVWANTHRTFALLLFVLPVVQLATGVQKPIAASANLGGMRVGGHVYSSGSARACPLRGQTLEGAPLWLSTAGALRRYGVYFGLFGAAVVLVAVQVASKKKQAGTTTKEVPHSAA